MQFCLLVTFSFSFTSFHYHCRNGKRAHVLFNCHVTLQLHSGTGNALFKKNLWFGGRTQQINWESFF